MLLTTVSAPDTSMSPITTLELMEVLTVGHYPMDCATYPCFAKVKATSLPIPFAPPTQCYHFSSSRQAGLRHVPVSTTTFPFARSAYANSSWSEMTVVMTVKLGGKQEVGSIRAKKTKRSERSRRERLEKLPAAANVYAINLDACDRDVGMHTLSCSIITVPAKPHWIPPAITSSRTTRLS